MYIKGSLKKYKKDGEEYFKVNKMDAKMTVGDGHIRLTAENPEQQFEGETKYILLEVNKNRDLLVSFQPI